MKITVHDHVITTQQAIRVALAAGSCALYLRYERVHGIDWWTLKNKNHEVLISHEDLDQVESWMKGYYHRNQTVQAGL